MSPTTVSTTEAHDERRLPLVAKETWSRRPEAANGPAGATGRQTFPWSKKAITSA